MNGGQQEHKAAILSVAKARGLTYYQARALIESAYPELFEAQTGRFWQKFPPFRGVLDHAAGSDLLRASGNR